MRCWTKSWWRSRLRHLVAAVALVACVAGALADEPPGQEAGAAAKKGAGKDHSPFPNPDAGYVTDIAGLLNAEQEEQIERWLWQTESKTGVEIVVVTTGSIKDYPRTPNRSVEAFATGLFNAYGIGNMPANDGVLLLVAVRDRKARIELGAGYRRRRDADANRIMQGVIVRRFKKDGYAEGITEGVKALMGEFAGVRVGFPWRLVVLPVGVVVVGLIAFSLFRNGKRGWGWVCVGLLIVLMLGFLQVLLAVLRHMSRGSSSSWSAGGFGGGFGGGFSGGGGATGSW